MGSFLRDIYYMVYILYVYQRFDNISYSEDLCGIHMYDETTHCSFYFTYDQVVEFKIEGEQPYYLHFEFIHMNNALQYLNEFMIYAKMQKEKKVLICCSSSMTSSYLCEMLNSYTKEHNEKISFNCCSCHMIEELYPTYDYILLAPQIAYQKVKYVHIPNLDVISTNDYATYNCYRIVEFIKKKVEE